MIARGKIIIMENTARKDRKCRLFAVATIGVGETKLQASFATESPTATSGKLFREVAGAFVFYD